MKRPNNNAFGPVLITLNETCSLIDMDPRLARKWVSVGGILEPAERGSKGRGCHHWLSGKQALALAFAWAFVRADIFTTRGAVRWTLESFEQRDWDELVRELIYWLRPAKDAWQDEERDARAMRDNMRSPWSFPDELYEDACDRMMKVYDTIEGVIGKPKTGGRERRTKGKQKRRSRTTK
jgi:hypothetical protein